MQFIRTSDWEDGIAHLNRALITALRQQQPTLWLVSGGSNIKPTVGIMENISAEHSQYLSIGLVDERYGPCGHDNSNWQQLMAAGLDTKQATVLDVLQTTDEDITTTTDRYEQSLQAALNRATTVIAQLGIGEDGHIAGILPESPATVVQDRLVTCYETELHDRITMTFTGLEHVTTAYVFAFGSNKLQALKTLKNRKLARAIQPAQILRQIPEVYIYNDQLGEQQ